MNLIKKHLGFRELILAMLLGLLVWAAVPIIFAAPASQNKYEQVNFSKAQALYHLTINDMFNKKIKLLIDNKGSHKGDCSDEKDITTYCLAEMATNEYFLYNEALQKKKENVEDSSLKSGDALIKRYIQGDTQSFLDRLQRDPKDAVNDLSIKAAQQLDRISVIDQELDDARKALDKSLAAYNELRSAYPMHLQLQETISNLVIYKDRLKKLSKTVETYPGKFHDATTTQCK